MSVELLFTGNGPGELAGWVRPVALAAREVAKQEGLDLHTTMALTPSQFASGREPEVIRGWGLFDRILEPTETVKLTLGVSRLPTSRSSTLVHLGGDLWFSARLSKRLGLPACVLAETTLVSRRHAPFVQVFATSEDVADQLIRTGVPGEKVLVTGDPRVDAVEMRPPHPDPLPQGERATGGGERGNDEGGYLVSFMPSSRDYLFKALVPYFLRFASQTLEREPSITFQMIASPFLSPKVVSALQEESERVWREVPLRWAIGEPWPALRESDFVITIPGTNTVELAAAGVPFAVIAPAEMLDHLRLEGIANWITRLPVLGRSLKRAVALKMLSSQRYIALPNQHAGRIIAPEWIGTWPEEAFVNHVVELLHDDRRRASMGMELQQLYVNARGASRRIAEHSIALAGGLGA